MEMVTKLERQLSTARRGSDYRKLLDAQLEALVQLDSGMVEGRVVPAEERAVLYPAVAALAERTFAAYAGVDAKGASRWIESLAVWRRPKDLDVAPWKAHIPVAGPALATAPTAPLATAIFEGSILDDDGVAVIASRKALRARYAKQAFDYEFPKALLAGMAAHELVGWFTGGEGEHAITVETMGDARAFGAIAGDDTTTELGVKLARGDALVVMPYSQFTYACAHAGGELDFQSGLATEVPLDAGRYRVRVHRAAVADGSAFRVLLCPTSKALPEGPDPEGDESDLPGWP